MNSVPLIIISMLVGGLIAVSPPMMRVLSDYMPKTCEAFADTYQHIQPAPPALKRKF